MLFLKCIAGYSQLLYIHMSMKNNTVPFIANVKPLKLNYVTVDCYCWHPLFAFITLFEFKLYGKKKFGYELSLFYLKNRINKKVLIFLSRSHKFKNIATYFLMTRDVSSLNSWSSFWFIYFQQHLKIYSLVLYNGSQTHICWKSAIHRLFPFHC